MTRVEGPFTYRRLGNGVLSSNTYIVWDETKTCAVIDPGNDANKIAKEVEKYELTVKYIILTHSHYDHIFYLEELKNMFPESVAVCHKIENENLSNPYKNGSLLFGSAKTFEKADETVTDGDILNLGKEELKIIHTPGHTEGGICIQAGKLLFTGDTLFYRSIGRTDLGDGNDEKMAKSLLKLAEMDPSLIVLAGHGTFSTIGDERKFNPYIGGLS